VIEIEKPSLDSWFKFMNQRYGNQWNKEVFFFLKRFENENFLLRMPETVEGTENFPTPRVWTWVALDMKNGFDSVDDINGLIGKEMGLKFRAFLKTKVDLDNLIANPENFNNLGLDAQYMAAMMLASWISKRATEKKKKDIKKCFGLIDIMSSRSREFIVLTCTLMLGSKLLIFMKELLKYNPEYGDILEKVANIGITIKPR